ncbi:molybdopterin-dependent oxidoreductase [Thalassorhabdomicrobium marinisediminis]|uniref:Asp-tRNA(Asn)/Glu-tRNA(Gln) amidotransferase GatCAB subunit C n=1 Tax=Thalassorhabdomicrobium marinisediminis TaxID=2170577 RepID=A0A2T7FTH7_9RHOB|nr:molybdopterin-dependent oxidoreductase [Thalassorhabdomicrobium marinisediminis]PVA05470.1 Asp-tRNA(Asn)/Glu-tRNA(Gln) amidotransferase GatCAB subunit C [Thalassorhabdomicrobium marinisediminis]
MTDRPDRSHMPLTAMHWGTYRAETDGTTLQALHPFEEDVDPSNIAQGYFGVLDGPTRITAPMVRKGWLEDPEGRNRDRRGADDFVEVSWGRVESLLTDELTRVTQTYGNEAIYGGSYGWASAGRFHHAQGHLRRFLNLIGGHTTSVNTYSLAAGEVICEHVIGGFWVAAADTTDWQSIVDNSEVFVAFGGLPLRNGQISQGGTGRHRQREAMLDARRNGVEFVTVSPLRDDSVAALDAQWIAPRPSTDVAMILGLCHTLLTEGLHDQAFLDRCTVGFDRFAAYLTGAQDGTPKTAQWAAGICDIDPQVILELARKMHRKRTMISASWSLTRQDHGEQPFWAAITLASMLGQIGLPGGGFGLGYSAVNSLGLENHSLPYAAMPQGANPVQRFIPVARITDMLENPGGAFDYNGQKLTYPDTRLIWWAGGNPFHHHQDLNRLRAAWRRPDTVVVNDWCWTATAQHADIVLPCTNPLERSDISMSGRDPYIIAMEQVSAPPPLTRNDYEIFHGLATRMGLGAAFSEGRDQDGWQRHLYGESRNRARAAGVELPDYDTLRARGWHKVPVPDKPNVMFEAFRADPQAHPIPTKSGKIELWSAEIDSFGYDDCPGHVTWLEPFEWLGNGDTDALHLISNQPRTKLHSQLDHGLVSQGDRPGGLERLRLNPKDAAARGLSDGAAVEVFNSRGACLARVVLDDAVRPGVAQMATGAWFNPSRQVEGLCLNGNPNVLTEDRGTSKLAQGPIAHTCLVKLRPAQM